MPHCGASCAVPSCASAPVVGFGSEDCSSFGRGLGFGCGYDFGSGLGSSVSAANLGVLPGMVPSCISQVPSSELLIQPAPVHFTIPGPILSASCEPVAVRGHAPCVPDGFGGGIGTGFYDGFGGGIGTGIGTGIYGGFGGGIGSEIYGGFGGGIGSGIYGGGFGRHYEYLGERVRYP